jgi:hypothetical protein
MSTILYKATIELGNVTSYAGRTLREAWLYASGLKRLENRFGSAAWLPDGVIGIAGAGLISASLGSCFGGMMALGGAAAGNPELAGAGSALLVYGGGGPLGVALGILNGYSHWKAGQHDYRLEQQRRAAALPAPSAKRQLVLK